MAKVSTHFKREEFACKCGCGFEAVDIKLLELLEHVRWFYNEPVVITSGNRCEEHNKAVGGAPESKHTKGIAADFYVKGVDASLVADFIEGIFPNRYGIGRYEDRVHVDVRQGRARWVG